MQLIEQIGVAVKEASIDPGTAGDPAHGELVTVGGGFGQNGQDTLVAPGAVGSAPFGEGLSSAVPANGASKRSPEMSVPPKPAATKLGSITPNGSGN
jgi:hypothetical protein